MQHLPQNSHRWRLGTDLGEKMRYRNIRRQKNPCQLHSDNKQTTNLNSRNELIKQNHRLLYPSVVQLCPPLHK